MSPKLVLKHVHAELLLAAVAGAAVRAGFTMAGEYRGLAESLGLGARFDQAVKLARDDLVLQLEEEIERAVATHIDPLGGGWWFDSRADLEQSLVEAVRRNHGSDLAAREVPG